VRRGPIETHRGALQSLNPILTKEQLRILTRLEPQDDLEVIAEILNNLDGEAVESACPLPLSKLSATTGNQ
jgi:hypothetical protein